MAFDPDMVNAARDPGPNRHRAAAPLLAPLLAAALALAGCSSVPGLSLFESPAQMRGHAVDAEDLRQITPGVSSRADVQALLGSPSATGTFDADNWYYISSVTRQRPGRQLAVEDQRVVVVSFDARGTVRGVREVGPEEGQAVAVVGRTTPAPGNERTFLQQLFGNLGRLAPGAPGASAGQTIGAPTR
jgi:outer membrane protein assembly factor BamE (lipoprotein component of BamABCDE complex)